MSFHGGFLGVLLALLLFARARGKRWLDVTDFVAPLVPLGLAAGRLGNFINGELWGRATERARGRWSSRRWTPRRGIRRSSTSSGWRGCCSSPLLWFYTRRRRPTGAPSGLFLVGYGACRFVAEYAREPDSFLGFLALGLTMGQWLSLPMIAAGTVMVVWAYRRRRRANGAEAGERRLGWACASATAPGYFIRRNSPSIAARPAAADDGT